MKIARAPAAWHVEISERRTVVDTSTDQRRQQHGKKKSGTYETSKKNTAKKSMKTRRSSRNIKSSSAPELPARIQPIVLSRLLKSQPQKLHMKPQKKKGCQKHIQKLSPENWKWEGNHLNVKKFHTGYYGEL